MNAWPEQGRGGELLAAVAARAEAWLFDPPPVQRPARVEREPPPRPVVAVVGLGRGCGTTTVARALGVELARRDPGRAAVVSAGSRWTGPAVATGAARRVARALGCPAVGRLALAPLDVPVLRRLAADRPAPLVLDVGHGDPPEPALALADLFLMVASPEVEPALAEVAAAALARDGNGPRVVLNRAADASGWRRPPDVVVGETRVGARLALAGRDPLGPLAAAAGVLADACAAAVAR